MESKYTTDKNIHFNMTLNNFINSNVEMAFNNKIGFLAAVDS